MNVLSLLPKPRAKGARASRPGPVSGKKAPAKPAAPQSPIPLPADLKRRLLALRRRHRLVAVGTGMAMILGAGSLLVLAQALSDWSFDLPWLARAGFLLTDGVLLGILYRRHLDRPLRKSLSLAATALLVERKWPKLGQSVITAVELAEGKSNATRGSRQLVNVVLEQARARTTNLNFQDVVPTAAFRRWALLGGIACVALVGWTAAAWPSSLSLLERIFLLNVPLPTRTLVTPLSRDMIVPVGSDVELAARAEGVIPTHGRLVITYDEGQPQEFPLAVRADKPGVFSFTVHNAQKAFKYKFYLNDGHGPEFSVVTRVPPAFTDLACTQVYPDYTKRPPQKISATALSLLAGSHLKVEASSTSALRSATVILKGVPQTIEATLDGSKTRLQADIPIPAKNVTGFSIHLVDDAGVNSVNETVYPINLIPDRLPLVKIVEPKDESETITLRAKPLIAFDASDDYGLTQLTLVYECIPPPVGGVDTPSLPQQRIPFKIKPPQDGTHYDYVLDVSAQVPPWQEGWTVNYWIEATDNNTATGPGVTKTDHKQFGIISPGAKQAEILARLKQDAANINALSDTQQKVSQEVGEAIPQK